MQPEKDMQIQLCIFIFANKVIKFTFLRILFYFLIWLK